MDELNDCCKLVDQVKSREHDRAVAAVQEACDKEIETLEARMEELEKLAFEKARAVSGLEGEIAGLKHKLAALEKLDLNVHVKMPPLKTTPVVVTLAQPAAKRTMDCVVCHRECISMCPECRAPVCGKQDCGVAHGHGGMYTSST